MKLFLKTAALSLLLVTWILANSASAEEWRLTVVGASGGDPRWSPSGKMLSVWRGDTVDVYNMDSLKLVKSAVANRPWSYYWFGEDRLAVFYKTYTEARRPLDKNLIATNALLRLDDGSVKVITCDTVMSRANCTTPWEKLSDGTIGVYHIREGVRNQFLKLADNRLVVALADTSKIIACESRFQPLRSKYEYNASPNCAWALAYRAADEVAVILDSVGRESFVVGHKVVTTSDHLFKCMALPTWSSNGEFVAFLETIEDGQRIYSANAVLVDVRNSAVHRVTELTTGMVESIEWSPTASEFVIIAPDLGGTLLCRRVGQ
jgi:dipeptidyl aminopeptidase/acylaminoacyl peptidase